MILYTWYGHITYPGTKKAPTVANELVVEAIDLNEYCTDFEAFSYNAI